MKCRKLPEGSRSQVRVAYKEYCHDMIEIVRKQLVHVKTCPSLVIIYNNSKYITALKTYSLLSNQLFGL